MHPRVTALVVARDDLVGPTLAALAAQTRRPDAVVVADASGRGVEAPGVEVLSVGRAGTGAAAVRAVRRIAADDGDDWVWLLPAGAQPAPDALTRLVGAIERFPSAGIVGPKLVDPDDVSLILSFGESLTRYGATVRLVDGELDQSQHDADDDVLGVALPGMAVRRPLWDRLGGADPALDRADAGLDLSVRARLAGARVIRVAGARVAVPADAEGLAPSVGAARRAQLHRRLAYAPALAVPLHWLALLPLAVLRSLGRLLGKRPAAIGAELAAALRTVFDGSVPAARARIRRSREVGWEAIAPLRIPTDEVRALRSARRDREVLDGPPLPPRPAFLPGGLAVVAAAVLASVAAFHRLIGAPSLTGGGVRALSDIGTLWSGVAWGPRDALGLSGLPDPFAWVLAVLGSVTAWAPSTVLALLWLAAAPAAALAAWWCATRLSSRPGPAALAAVLWAAAPPLWAALAEGRIGAVIAHLLLPWLVLAAIEGVRSWGAAATAGLLFAAVTASAPSLAPVLAVAVVAWALAHPRALVRVLAILVPAAALALPLVLAQLARGTVLGLVADPGPALGAEAPSGWWLLLGVPSPGGAGWPDLAAAFDLPAATGGLAAAIALAPLAVLALLAVFLPGSRRAIPSLLLALAGLLTAVAAAHVVVAGAGVDPVTPWPGAGLSLYWAGLAGSAVVAVDALGRGGGVPAFAAGLAGLVAVAPLAVGLALGGGAVEPGSRSLPALVGAEAAADPTLGTLVLSAQQDGSLAARLERGAGTALDGFSTFATTAPPDESTAALAELAGNLASPSGFDAQAGFDRWGIDFVLLRDDPGGDASAVHQRAAESLDGSPSLEPVGETALGILWRVSSAGGDAPAVDTPAWAPGVVAVQAALLGAVLLLALPTRVRRRPVRVRDALAEQAEDFSEDDRDD